MGLYDSIMPSIVDISGMGFSYGKQPVLQNINLTVESYNRKSWMTGN